MSRKRRSPKVRPLGKQTKFFKKSKRGYSGQAKQAISFQKGQHRISDEDLIGFIYANGGTASLNDLLSAFDLGRSYRKILQGLLQNLCHEKRLRLLEDRSYAIAKTQEYFEGILSVAAKGFGFVNIDKALFPDGPDELFIPPREFNTAMHGDKVLVKIIHRRGAKPIGQIIRVLARNVTKIVGIFTAGKPTGIVTPEDERFPFNIIIRFENSGGAKNGEAVVVRITQFDPSGKSAPKGEIIEVLGNPDSLRVQTEIVIRKFNLPHVFSTETVDQVKQIDGAIAMQPGREDLRDILHITIDGETARDFDDAVAVQKTKTGYRLYVSIADVSHYVKDATPLDQDAYQRGTSVYFPTMVVPMLPERLSNDLCSLVPNQDRFAFSAIMDFDKKGELIKKRFCKSLIISHYRMTYTLVRQILVDKDKKVRAVYKPLLTPLKWMAELGMILNEKRDKRGSIGFEIPEAYIEVGEKDNVMGINRRERNLAHQLIEEFMLAANEAVALTLSDQNEKSGLYRIHEAPDPIKVAEFATFARTMGLDIPPGEGSPHWFGRVLDLVEGTPQEYIVNNLLLRTMKQARYSPDNVGHFGLAATHYCHFTSPIRRYPDLMVHRALEKLIRQSPAKGGKKAKSQHQSHNPHEAGEFLSKRERVAVDAEREMVDRMKVRYMEDKIGEIFDGIISGISSFGLFVELLESFISGGIAISDLKDDYYRIDEKNHRLIGERKNKIYQIGQLVRVKVTSVEKSRRRINFVLTDEQPSAGQ